MYFREHLRVRKLLWQKQSWSHSAARRRVGCVILLLIPGAAFLHCNGYETCGWNTGRWLYVLISLGFVAPSVVSAAARAVQRALCLVACLLTVSCHLRFREGEMDKGQKRWERKEERKFKKGRGQSQRGRLGMFLFFFNLERKLSTVLRIFFFHVPWPSIAIPVKHY